MSKAVKNYLSFSFYFKSNIGDNKIELNSKKKLVAN